MICNICYIVVAALLASSHQVSPEPTPALTVVTTTGMIADVAREIGGDRVQVDAIMGEGVDPHLYKPTASDVRRVLRADVVLYNGLRLEGRMGDALARSREAGRVVVAVAETCPPTRLHPADEEEEHPADGEEKVHADDGHEDGAAVDPHVWMDVSLWSTTIDGIQDAFCQADPSGCPTYRKNADASRQRLLTLHRDLARQIATIPEERRVLVTAHDAFGYFGSAYGVEVRAVQGISTASEAGLAELNDLVAFIVARRLPAVFIESSVSPRAVEALVEGARAAGHTVQIGGELYSDAMGKPGTPEGTYEGMMRHNARTITTALGGTVTPPEPASVRPAS